LEFALTGNVRNFIEKVVGDEQLKQERNHKVNRAGVIVLLPLPAFGDPYAIFSAGEKKKKSTMRILKLAWRCQLGWFKNIPKLPLKLNAGVE